MAARKMSIQQEIQLVHRKRDFLKYVHDALREARNAGFGINKSASFVLFDRADGSVSLETSIDGVNYSLASDSVIVRDSSRT
jgi:hypothetical protein